MGIIYVFLIEKSTLKKHLHHVVVYVEQWTFQYTEMMTIPLLYLFSFFNIWSQLLKK